MSDNQQKKSPVEERFNMEQYLASTDIIDWKTPEIIKLALSAVQDSEENIALACFEWVRDNIKHSWDYKLNPTTCKASDVLKYKTGYCYGKSHLLAALLRANHIPRDYAINDCVWKERVRLIAFMD